MPSTQRSTSSGAETLILVNDSFVLELIDCSSFLTLSKFLSLKSPMQIALAFDFANLDVVNRH